MVKPLIFALSMLSGTGLFTYAVSVQHQRQAPVMPSLQPSPESVYVVPPPRAAVISEPEPVTVEPIIELEPVVIEASATRRAKPEAAPVRTVSMEEPRATTPCSSWRELGPQFVSAGAQPGTHQVRELCD